MVGEGRVIEGKTINNTTQQGRERRVPKQASLQPTAASKSNSPIAGVQSQKKMLKRRNA
jgi:hypothetical protein